MSEVRIGQRENLTWDAVVTEPVGRGGQGAVLH